MFYFREIGTFYRQGGWVSHPCAPEVIELPVKRGLEWLLRGFLQRSRCCSLNGCKDSKPFVNRELSPLPARLHLALFFFVD